jgi:hypothetical protein
MECGRGSFGGPCVNPEPKEDPYEYAIQRSNFVRTDRFFIVGDYWGEKEERTAAFRGFQKPNAGGSKITYKLVKRRKAGPIEDA